MNSKLPFSLTDVKKQSPIRASQEKMLELAEKSFQNQSYSESLFFFEKVKKTVTLPSEKEMIQKNIDYIHDLKNPKKEPEKKENPVSENKQFPSNDSSPFQLTIENISLSGIQFSGEKTVTELLHKMLTNKESEKEKIINQISEDANEKEWQGELDKMKALEQSLIIQENGETQSSVEIENNRIQQSEALNLLEEIQKSEGVFNTSEKTEVSEKNNTVNQNESVEKSGITQTSGETNNQVSSSSESPPLDPSKLEVTAKIENNEPKKEEIKAPPEKFVEKVKPVQLTYNFNNVFFNKYYLKYSDMFNEAAVLVRERRLDDAIEYYKVILDQKLPETMKMMIQKNIEDLKETILNTFKASNTIVRMNSSGNLVTTDDSQTIKIIDSGNNNRNDIFFKED
ncbi:MAG TPA: hypothetical protein DHW82_10185 [Spirochaetia bacterium]|nr:MAG: hypothetical protein A2Y41_14135 [Spirochaetes bacterium GWB1_36_13]HCL57359.1 hypothetical protein [Spirochaetia bacterium]